MFKYTLALAAVVFALTLAVPLALVCAWLSGAGTVWILRRHILPNMVGTLTVQATYGFAGVIRAETSLSFLGLGPHVPYSLGALLAQGTTYLWRSTHMTLFPGLTLALVVLGCNLVGDVLRDRMAPPRPSLLA